MDIAICSLDNVTYNSTQFSKLDFSEMSEKRRSLFCPECNGPAFFRKETRNGRAACFGARPHAPGCSLSVLDETRITQGQTEVAEIINNPGERIVVDLDFGTHQHVHADPNAGPFRGGVRAGMHIGGHASNNARMHRRLSTLLKTLIESPNFRTSQQILEILGREISVRDFFVPLLDISESHLNTMKGFWGMISDIGSGINDTVWLNSGGRGNISFCMDKDAFKQLCQRFNISDSDPEELSGAYILAIGEAKISQNGKIYCSIDNQNMICIRLT